MEIKRPRGTKDFFGTDYQKRSFLIDSFKEICENTGFKGVLSPMYEQRDLFERSAGAQSDVVEKEMFDLEKKGELQYSLRPELTAGIVRFLIEDGLKSKKLPIMVYSFGEVFRYDKPQKARYRQHNQLDVEIFGCDNPAYDVFGIFQAWRFLKKLAPKEKLIVSINSLGSNKTKVKFSKILKDYFSKNKQALCEDCRRRLDLNPLRILDCKQPGCKKIASSSPKIGELLTETEKKDFEIILAGLQGLGVKYIIDQNLIRGLDYYTSTIFEINLFSDERRNLSLGGGGRYDDLVKQLNGPDISAFGFGLGIERICELVQFVLPKKHHKTIYIIPLSDGLKINALALQARLSTALSSYVYLRSTNLSQALADASKNEADFAIILGEDELKDQNVIVKNLSNSTQKRVLYRDVEKELG